MKKRLISVFYLLVFLFTKIIFWLQKPKGKTERIFKDSSCLWNIFHPVTPIGNQIYLGSCVQASNIIFLENLGITHIVNVSMEIPNFYSHQFHYYNLRIRDNGLESFEKKDLDKVKDYIEETLKNKDHKVLIHCYSGRSRSLSVLSFYLCSKYNFSIETITYYLKKKRPIINPSVLFYQNLKDLL